MFTLKNKRLKWLTAQLIFLYISFGIISFSGAEEISESVKGKIKDRFPGARIEEIREDIWEGNPVTEVEARTVEGRVYEFIISQDEDILHVEEEKELPLIGGELFLGAAAFFKREIYRGVDNEIQPVPFLRYQKGPFEIQTTKGVSLSYSIFGGSSYSVAVLGEISFEEGYDPGDSVYLSGMDELNSTYSVGLGEKMMLGRFVTGIEVLHDISGEESGQKAEFSVSYPWRIAGFELSPGLNVSFLSKKKVDYLYGVSAGEARLDRPIYNPGSCFEIGAELMIQKPFLRNFVFVTLLEVNKLGSEIHNSPIVDKDIEASVAMGVMYRF